MALLKLYGEPTNKNIMYQYIYDKNDQYTCIVYNSYACHVYESDV